MLANPLNHLVTNVLPAVRDYEQAEAELGKAFDRNPDPASWEQASQHAKGVHQNCQSPWMDLPTGQQQRLVLNRTQSGYRWQRVAKSIG